MGFKKLVFVIAFLGILAGGFFVNAQPAQAASVEELMARIAQLRAQIQELQKQLQIEEGTTLAWCHTFNTNLRIGDVSEEVAFLQVALQKEGLIDEEISSNEFEEKVASAVVGFQERYKNEILTPYKLARGTGFVGKSTRAKLNSLYGCSVSTIQPVTPPVTVVPTPTPTSTPQPVAPSITILSPNGGETWILGSDQVVRWEGTRYQKGYETSFVLIDATETKIHALNLVSIGFVVDHNEATISVPAYLAPGSYRLQMTMIVNGARAYDNSDGYITVAANTVVPSITVLSPNGGETWAIGEIHRISWSSIGTNKVWIKYSDGSGNAFLIASLDTNPGYYDWAIPSSLVVGSAYKIEVVDSATVLLDWSDNYFNIVASPITILSPSGGESWAVGSTHNVTWKYSGPSTSSCTVGVNLLDTRTNIPAGGSTLPIYATSGVYSYTVSPGSPMGSNVFKIQIVGVGNSCGTSGMVGLSNNYLSIVSASVAVKPSVDLKVNASDGPVTLAKGGNAGLIAWEAKGVDSCAASLGGAYDLNGDGYVNINDVTLYTSKNPGVTVEIDLLLKEISRTVGTLGGAYDINGDGLVTGLDISMFSKYNPLATAANNPFLSGMIKAYGIVWQSGNINSDTNLSWNGEQPLSGNASTGTMHAGQTLVLSCSGPQGTFTDSVGVIVK